MAHYLHLSVKEIITETDDTKTIVFWQPIHQSVQYKAGQFITVIVNIDGQKYRRSYSMSSSPREANVAITVKKLPYGLVSKYLCEQVKVGDVLEVLEPSGHFVVEPNESQERSLVFVAGGSGITPIFSMIKTLLPVEKHSKIYLVYASRNEESIIFKKELHQLELDYSGRFKVLHVLSQPSYTWVGYKTRINQASMVIFLKQDLHINIPMAQYYLCGPDGMMQQVENALALFNVADNQIHKEHFVSSHESPTSQVEIDDSPKAYTITLNYEGQSHQLIVKPHETILEAAMEADIDLPYSCQAGMCTACMGRCVAGRIRMDEEDGLTEAEIAQGYVLTCVSHPISDGVVVDIE